MTMPRIPFIEPKEPDWFKVAELSALSVRAKRWTNYGPLGEMFAAEVADIVGLGPDRVVVPASSATTALQAVTGLHAVVAGRPLVWAVSAFGFFSTVIGPLAGRVKVIDCDRSGMPDLDQLAALLSSLWDGLILTDIFGFNIDMSPYKDLCSAYDKPLVIDSAASFPARRSLGHDVSEVISFHHTKPWGFGEGGCAIIDRRHADLVRALLDYGKDVDSKFACYATNGKMSDVAAAVIIDRLLRRSDWSRGYNRQRQRIFDLVAKAAIGYLGRPAPEVISPHVPLMAPRAAALDALPQPCFKVEKYYRPLSPDCPVAADIFARIINVPCHPMMAEVTDAEILDCLQETCQTVAT
jgi:dTDP-4-amino-4,6-dideoxygalactose transaminase